MKTTQADIDFLLDLHDWIKAGKPANQFAKERGIVSGTVTYRLHRFGLKAKRAVGLVKKRSDLLLPELIASGDVRPDLDDTPAPATEPVAA